MALAFDTLGYSRRLREAGLDPNIADAAADAARDYIMLDLVTTTELHQTIDTAVLRLTVRMGVMIGAGIAALGILIRLT